MYIKDSVIPSSFIIGFIDGVRLPFILLCFLTLYGESAKSIQHVLFYFIPFIAVLLATGHWLTIKSENKAATGERQLKEEQIQKNIGVDPVRPKDFQQQSFGLIVKPFQYVAGVGFFVLIGGLLVILPLLFTGNTQLSFLLTAIIVFVILFVAGFIKGKYYNVNPLAEAFRTSIIPFIALGLAYGLTKIF